MNTTQTSQSASGSERRSQQRHVLSSEVHYKMGTVKRAQGIDVSDAGICIATEEPIEPGTEVPIYLLGRNVEVLATVSNDMELSNGRHRIGLGFWTPQPEVVQMVLSAQGHRHD